VLAATLPPSTADHGVEWRQVFCGLCGRAALADGLANVLLFIPLGMALGCLGVTPRRAVVLAGSLSLSVELAQFVIPGRDPRLSDFAFNVVGAALGLGLSKGASGWLSPEPRAASRLSLAAAAMAAAAFVLTDALLTVSLPHADYFGGSPRLQPLEGPLRIGSSTEPESFFQGRIDEIRVYRRARTATEIQADMSTPVSRDPGSADLVGAYAFDEGSGSILRDASGHGNMGRTHGAFWTNQGRFGAALVFDGVRSSAVVPSSASLSLSEAMTLGAWIYPTAIQKGWRGIVHKDLDAYFLFAGYRSSPLKPGGGGTFGSSTELMAAPAAVSPDTWTHVALTYDGAVLTLYIDGRPVSRRLRWYPGRVLSAELDGMTIPSGLVARSQEVRAGLLGGVPLRVRAIASAPVPVRAPLVTLLDASRNEIMLLAVERDDVLFRLRTRAATAELDSPAVRAPQVMHGLRPGDPVVLTVSRAHGRYCVDVNRRSVCVPGFTLGTGWTFLAYSQVPSGWPHTVLNLLWVAALLFPFGFWLRLRRESMLAALVLATGVLLPCTVGGLTASPGELGAGIAAILTGRLCAVLTTQ
jgi:glycopeptide antibiotics resistance protein